ncbi:MAG: sigma-70 family RNA polymerase sigma factor [Planctomycetota bacterium]
MHTIEEQFIAGNRDMLGEVFSLHSPRLWQIIRFRMDAKIRARVDVDDVLQDVFMDAQARVEAFFKGEFQSVFLWLRLVTSQTLSKVHRTHLGTELRAVTREKNANLRGHWPDCSLSLSFQFVAHMTSPSGVAVREEVQTQIHQALECMSDLDQEIVALRHFEELSNQEVAAVLGISNKAASIRYVRALERLRLALSRMPGFVPPS